MSRLTRVLQSHFFPFDLRSLTAALAVAGLLMSAVAPMGAEAATRTRIATNSTQLVKAPTPPKAATAARTSLASATKIAEPTRLEPVRIDGKQPAPTETKPSDGSKPTRVIQPVPSGPRRVLVELEVSKLRDELDAFRRRARLDHDDEELRKIKRTEYRARVAALLRSLEKERVEVVHRYDNLPLVALHVETDDQVAALARRDDVAAVHENTYFRTMLTQTLPQVGQPTAANAGATGRGTTVAVLDTGVDFTLPEFGSCGQPGEPGCRVRFAGEFAIPDGAMDDDGHGTNVSAIVLGMAPDTGILALDVFDRILGDQLTDVFGLAAAIDFVIDTKFLYNTVAMNLSLGTDGAGSAGRCLTPIDALFAEAVAVGITPIVAAGNDWNPNRVSIPACSPWAVAVGAVDDADAVTGFSNASPILDLLAPGADVVAAGIQMSGTSQATPHVAGAWAVMRGARPELQQSQVLQALIDTGVPVLDPRNGLTFPRIQLDAALGWTGTAPLIFLGNYTEVAAIEFDWLECQMQEVTDGAACGYETVQQTIVDAAECGEIWVTDAAECGADLVQCGTQTVVDAAECGTRTVANLWECFEALGAFEACELPAECEVDVFCEEVQSCWAPDTCTIDVECDPTNQSCTPESCEVEICEL